MTPRGEAERLSDEMRERFERVEEEDFMRNPQRWPMNDRLPLKRIDLSADSDGFGYLVRAADFGVEPVVHSDDGAVAERRYASFEDLVADGWRVD